MKQTIEFSIGDATVTMETGQIACHANGAVWVSCGGTVVLATATADFNEQSDPLAPLSLRVHYQEKLYATGRIPAAFTKRQGKRSDRETLLARSTDRCLRPLFPPELRCPIEIVIEVMSIAKEMPPEALALQAASMALMLSDIPFAGPTTSVRISRKQQEAWQAFQYTPQAPNKLLVGISDEGISMLEGAFAGISEAELLEATTIAQSAAQPALDAQRALHELAAKAKHTLAPTLRPTLDENALLALAQQYRESVLAHPSFLRQRAARQTLRQSYLQLCQRKPDDHAANLAFEDWERAQLFLLLDQENRRLDGRKAEAMRTPQCEIDRLPATHGSAIFSRGDTQVIAIVTLGGQDEELLTETLTGMTRKHFFVHYNFPSYAAGRHGRFGIWGRREIGHGQLIERALRPTIPSRKAFAYTKSVITEVTSADGSSSMASVCATTLALLSAGVPLSQSIAGIAVGMLSHKRQRKLLLDPLSQEDSLGDMDCKVCGSRDGITAIQMDLKCPGLSLQELEASLTLARQGRLQLLDAMDACIDSPRPLSPQAPRQENIKISTACAKELLGHGGTKLRKLKEQSGTKMIVNPSGNVQVTASDECSLLLLKSLLDEIESSIAEQPAANAPQTTPEPTKQPSKYDPPLDIGALYTGTVTHIKHYGAFVEIQPGVVGLLHISELTTEEPPRHISHYVSQAQELTVKLIQVDKKGRIGLSLLQAISDDSLETPSS